MGLFNGTPNLEESYLLLSGYDGDIKEIYGFEFKESHKDISLKIDNKISNKALSLYFKLL
tara:strand:+ start:338 stop:517 length:180 start_codon:yes stop_codon:yes gene_type:complete